MPAQEKAKYVGEVFDGVAEVYDRMNDFMSAGIHRWWKNVLVSDINAQAGEKVLDLAGGTG